MKWSEINGIRLSVCGLMELPSYAGAGVTHLVSIWPGGISEQDKEIQEVHALFKDVRRLFLFFNDVIEADAAYPPRKEDVARLLGWTENLQSGDRVLLHCSAGVSRSTALAFSILCQHWGDDAEIECFVELMGIRPTAVPNPLLVAYADDLLTRNGKMTKAIIADRFEE